jgi:hypothetical protein
MRGPDLFTLSKRKRKKRKTKFSIAVDYGQFSRFCQSLQQFYAKEKRAVAILLELWRRRKQFQPSNFCQVFPAYTYGW